MSNPAWTLSRDSWEKLLRALDPDPARAAEEYELIRRKLIRFFEWRQMRDPERLADISIDRVARKFDEGETILEVSKYCYAVAKLVLLEETKREARSHKALDQIPQPAGRERSDPRHGCLDSCLAELAPETRRLIVSYYEEDKSAKIEHRQALADSLGISMNVLRIRACRVRSSLEECLQKCLGEKSGGR